MAPLRLANYPEGERLSLLHQALLDKCDKLEESVLVLRERPEQLQAQKLSLEERIGQMLADEAERKRLEALIDPNSAEQVALRQLKEAKTLLTEKENELRRLRIATETARNELQKMTDSKSQLQRALDGERAELHKLRQEKRTTQLPVRVHSDVSTHTSPRQQEHPELTSPRQAQRQQLRAASAGLSRSRGGIVGGIGSVGGGSGGTGGGGSVGASPRQRPFSARPSVGEHPTTATAELNLGGSAGSLYVPQPPAGPRGGSANLSTFLTERENSSPRGTNLKSAMRQQSSSASGGGPSSSSSAAGPRVDVSTQTNSNELREIKELQRANQRLQTALLAAALDPDGGGTELSGLLAAVDRGLTSAGARGRQARGFPADGLLPHQIAAKQQAKSARATIGGNDGQQRPWPIPKGRSGVPPSQLPKGFQLEWPAMA